MADQEQSVTPGPVIIGGQGPGHATELGGADPGDVGSHFGGVDYAKQAFARDLASGAQHPVAEVFSTPDPWDVHSGDVGSDGRGEPQTLPYGQPWRPFEYIHASELHTSLGEQLWAEAKSNFMAGTRGLMRMSAYSSANGIVPDFGGPAPPQVYDAFDPAKLPSVPIAAARDQVKAAGLEQFVTLPQQDEIKQGVLDLMLDDARDRAQYNAAVVRGPQGFFPGALGAVTSIGLGMIDPVNAAAFAIPLVGACRRS